LIEVQESTGRTLEEVVSRALCDNLGPLQRTASELEQALGEFMAACSSAKPGNALPAMLRAQAFAASLSASLSVLSNFTAIALNQSGGAATVPVRTPESAAAPMAAPARPEQARAAAPEPTPAASVTESRDLPVAERPLPEQQTEPTQAYSAVEAAPLVSDSEVAAVPQEMELELTPEPVSLAAQAGAAAPAHESSAAAQAAFDITTFPAEIQELHRRANRVAKVAMQDIKLLRPQDVQLGREHKDICDRLRSDLDKARKEYDRRFRAIQDHPVDYFHRWMVEILAQGDEHALGEYPYPSPVLRH
jgi:hypothetical protein